MIFMSLIRILFRPSQVKKNKQRSTMIYVYPFVLLRFCCLSSLNVSSRKPFKQDEENVINRTTINASTVRIQRQNDTNNEYQWTSEMFLFSPKFSVISLSLSLVLSLSRAPPLLLSICFCFTFFAYIHKQLDTHTNKYACLRLKE